VAGGATMNPFVLKNPDRIQTLIEVLEESLAVHRFNHLQEKHARPSFMKPAKWVNNLLVVCQYSDEDKHDFNTQETIHIQEGGPVDLSQDGTISQYLELPGVMFW
jgi:hypothetical protein